MGDFEAATRALELDLAFRLFVDHRACCHLRSTQGSTRTLKQYFMQQCAEAPSVIRTAATAGLIMVGKYYALTDDNEVYRIAMGENLFISNPHSLSHPFLFAVMLPNKKMAQFI